jgi:predicted enzyme related to lactoylglutathione lyase
MNKKASLLRTTVVVKDFERQVSFYSDAVNLELMKTVKIPSSRISAHPICASNLGSTMTLGFMQSGGQTMLGLMAFDCEVLSGQGNLIFCCRSIEESISAFVDAGGKVAREAKIAQSFDPDSFELKRSVSFMGLDPEENFVEVVQFLD